MEGHHPGQEPAQDKERKANSISQKELEETGLLGPAHFPPRIPLSSPPPSLFPASVQRYLPAPLHEVFLKQDLGLEAAVTALGLLCQIVEPGVGEALGSAHPGPVERGWRGESRRQT